MATTLITSIVVALGSGTNYVYSAYAPQLGARLKINHTQLNVIGLAGNIGVYASGPLWGRVIDARGPRIPLASAFLLLLIGYSGIRLLYDHGLTHHESSIPSFTFLLLVLFSHCTGIGGNAGTGSALNSTAKSFPDSARATTVGLVLSGFGLSAFLFSTISRVFFPGNTSHFLLLLSLGTALPMILGLFFIRPVPLPQQRNTSTPLDDRTQEPLLQHDDSSEREEDPEPVFESTSSTTARLSRRRALLLGDASLTNVYGQGLARSSDFWLLFIILSLLSGTGIMYINNVGSMSQALYAKESPKYDDVEASKWQTTQVSTLSVMNCAGRIIIGLLCDYGKRRFDIPRSTFLILVSSLFFISQVVVVLIRNVHNLWIATALLGLAHGSVFSLFPTVCAEWFGMPHFSENYGYLQTSPIFAGNLFSLVFGRNLDAHETSLPIHVASSGGNNHGPPRCSLGRECYVDTLYLTMGACLLGMGLSVWAYKRDKEKLRKAVVVSSIPA